MLTFIPKPISNKGIAVYLTSLLLVTIVFWNYAMDFQFFAIGIVFVFLFFYRSQQLSVQWYRLPPHSFSTRLFWSAFAIRVVWVIFSYFFYIANTGQPFEWNVADAMGYHEEAKWLSQTDFDNIFDYYSNMGGVSDVGYSFYLTLLYKVIGPNLIVTRLIKAILSAYTCVLVYKLSARTFGESTGRIAGLFALFMPNLIIYCGYHLKETEMLFCVMMFLERSDYLFRSHNYSFKTILVPSLFALSLFFFRTVLGATAFLSFFTAFLLENKDTFRSKKKLLVIIWISAILVFFAGSKAVSEMETLWNKGSEDQVLKRQEQTERGAQWAKYATGTVMAPMIFVIPFSTMIDTDQLNQNVIHGGTFIKNFLGIFVIFALFYAIKLKKWRNFSLIGSFAIFYLMVISFSGFANAERFHLPALPCILMMAAYGLSQLNAKNYKYAKYWCFIVVIMELSWAFFKLGNLGLVSL